MNERSNMSYTNKDFNSIYNELLEYAKKLSYRWDPTISDESDPAVVLLKLAAIVGDKDNYNIDKNVLELMPGSVTQPGTARQLFEQCGYSMHYYLSAEGSIDLVINKDLGEVEESQEYIYAIPQFTMFTNADKSVVYTSVAEARTGIKELCSVDVIEGKIINYTINNDPLITVQNLDNKNRLYFTDTDISENGIFITNVNTPNYSEWKKVDNIELQDTTLRTYKFGLTNDNSICFIEFSDDAVQLFGEGINIKYVKTNGSNGDVPKNRITDFYVDTKFIRHGGSNGPQEVDATTDNIRIRNTLPIMGGADPEQIDDAYRAYKRVRDTFNTLVSLKDYTDYMVSEDYVSNGYVCDRTNDIQHCYKILKAGSDSTNYFSNVIEPKPDESKPSMNAFNICVYPLTYMSNVSSTTAFKETFALRDGDSRWFESEDIKSLQHDFIGFDDNKILMLKNKYTIKANIIPKYTLSASEKNDVLYNVELALCKALNARQMTFGEDVSLDVIKNTIIGADERIKALVDFMSPTYETYAIYHVTETDENGNVTNKEFKELRIDMASDDGGYVQVPYSRKKPTDWDTKNYYTRNELTGSIESVDDSDKFDPLLTYYTYDSTLHDLWYAFRVEVYAKNILCGTTPLYDDANDYPQTIVQQNTDEHVDIEKVTTNTNIVFTSETSGEYVSRELTKNENVLFTAPSFIEENNFSSYVKFVYQINKSVSAKSKHFLQDTEFIIFFYKNSDEDTEYSYIKYDNTTSSPAQLFSPTFTMDPLTNVSDGVNAVLNYARKLDAGVGTVNNNSDINNNIKQFLNNDGSKDGGATTRTVTTGTAVITTYKINEIHINNDFNGASHVYWILNNLNSDKKYELFSASNSTGGQEYTLGSGEYFMYTNTDKTVLDILGEGTIIKRKGTKVAWTVDPVEYSELLSQGISILDDKWFTLTLVPETKYDANYTDDNPAVWAQEQQLVLVGPNSVIRVKNKDPETLSNTSSDLFGSNVEVAYRETKPNAEYTVLEKIDSNDYGWSATSILNIEMSPTKPQELTSNQSFKFHPIESGIVTVDGPCYVSSDVELNMAGGQNIAVSTILNPYINFLTYTVPNDTSNVNPATGNFEFKVEVPTGGDIHIVPLDLLEGNYLLPVETSESIGLSISEATLGRNLLPFPYSNDTTISNVEFTNTEDGRVKAFGKLSSGFVYTLGSVKLKRGYYIISVTVDGTESMNHTFNVIGASSGALTDTASTDNSQQFYIDALQEVTVSFETSQYVVGDVVDCTYSFMLESVKDETVKTPSSWEPYGWSYVDASLNADIKISNLFDRYYKLEVTDSETAYALTLVNNSEKDASVILEQPFKYDNNKYKKFRDRVKTVMSGDEPTTIYISFESELIDKLKDLDKECEFDYTYCSKTPITNPLDSNMFLRSNHFYNKFTICEWDTIIQDNTVIHDIFR